MPGLRLNRLQQKRNANGLVGIEVSPDGLALAHVVHTGARGDLRVCDFIRWDSVISDNLSSDNLSSGNLSSDSVGSDSDSALNLSDTNVSAKISHHLKQCVAALGLQRMPVNWALGSPQYSLLLVEAPSVAEAELREAMRWRVQELSPVPIEEATLDVFPLPTDGTRGGAKMVYVVVAHKTHIQNTIQQAHSANLNLSSIDIAEMCLRNIAERVVSDDRSAAVLRIRRGSANLALVRREKLYFSRQFDLPYNGGLLDDLPEDNIVLEVQRSIDYYERQMHQVPPQKIFICGDHVSPDKITASLQSSLPAKPVCLQLQQFISGAENMDENIVGLCVGALGAALRKPKAA